MKIVIAPDKFKGSLSAEDVCTAVATTLIDFFPSAEINSVPLADGGEGTSGLLTLFFKGKKHQVRVSGPLFESIDADYGVNQDGTTAFIEMAKASGLQLIPKEKQNPLYTTTLGTGELIRHAIDQRVKKIILGIGGSATNDAGIGVAEALGYEFYDRNKKRLKPTGENLINLDTISSGHVHPQLHTIEFIALCDVNNPLYGTSGAAFVYGPQKGADFKIAKQLDEGLRNFERVISKTFNKIADFPGAGAGGGIASGTRIFLNAQMQKGIQYIIQATELEKKIKQADLVITGEGKVDTQTLSGKVISAVAELALKYNKPLILLCGVCELRKLELEKIGIKSVISLTDPFTSSEEAIKNAPALIRKRINENRALFHD
jgi:glycerate 2-kinase